MAKYINREELVAWLQHIPLKDLSDGRGLCRIITEEDFKRAIRTVPEGAIVDLEPVVYCRHCRSYNKPRLGVVHDAGSRYAAARFLQSWRAKG